MVLLGKKLFTMNKKRHIIIEKREEICYDKKIS
jgi:hypothetical protein